jgi:hypothetical protein
MGELVDPKPPQWERKAAADDVRNDGTIDLAQRIMELLSANMEPMVVQLAALRLVQKAVIGDYHFSMGKEATTTLLQQAKELAEAYVIRGPDGTTEY